MYPSLLRFYPFRKVGQQPLQSHTFVLIFAMPKADNPKANAAQQKLDAAASGSEPSEDLVNKRAFDLFSYGSLELTRAVLDKFLGMRDVKQLLPDAVQQTRRQVKDAKTAKELLATAKLFFTSMMSAKSGKTGGRRTDVEMNVYWASAASLIPRDIFEPRHGRAAARLLGIPYRTVKRASTIRKKLEDAAVGSPPPPPFPSPPLHPHPTLRPPSSSLLPPQFCYYTAPSLSPPPHRFSPILLPVCSRRWKLIGTRGSCHQSAMIAPAPA